MQFHKLKVANTDQLTPLSKKITFELPRELNSFYTFKSGQYVSLELNIDGNKIRRSYSICSSKEDNLSFSIGVKEIQDGYGSKYLNKTLNNGDFIEVSTPEGGFLLGDISNDKQYVFVAGGSGITPILSMLYELLSHTTAPVFLKYSTLTQEETMFYNELKGLEAKYPQLKIDFLFTNGENILNENNLAEWIRNTSASNYDVWVCGPSGIISSTEKACQLIGLAPEKFHREYFTAKSSEDMLSASVGDSTDAPLSPGEAAEVEIKYEGKKLKFTCQYNETILDAALNAGGDPPYSCLVAACSTCRAMVKTGNIEMKDRDALSDKDIAKGFVLTCQSMPRSKKIVMDYDV
jgi:ring-1,2-phenylacetyl-CoA epoxidase subunit PaaE